jgi:hypothetical protein
MLGQLHGIALQIEVRNVIDIGTERLLTLAQAAALLPDRPSVCTLWRWRTKGVRGRRLESLILRGKVYTSVEALQRFAEEQGGLDGGVVTADSSRLRSPATRERDIERAELELAELGI